MGKKRTSGPPVGGGETMQLDAIADDFEEVDIPDLGVHAPPPLPPKSAGFGVWIAGGLVVLLAAGAAVGIGLYLKSTSVEPAPAAAASPPAEPVEAEAPEEAPATRIQMDDIVFGDEPSDDEGAEPEPSE